MEDRPDLLAWNYQSLPTVVRAGRYPLEDRNFAYSYLTPTTAIHLYDYVGTIRIGTSEFALQPGDLTITPANRESRYDVPTPGHHWCIHAYAPRRHGPAVELPIYLRLGKNAAFVAERFRTIAQLVAEGGELAEARAAIALQDLMLYLAAMHRSAATSPVLRSDLAVERAAFELDTHFSRPLSVPELADAVGINQNHLARCFRRKMGVTIPRYLLQRRMEHARFLLHSTDMPVRVIARRVGMPDPQHFNKQFRKLCGTSPTAWRELSRKGG